MYTLTIMCSRSLTSRRLACSRHALLHTETTTGNQLVLVLFRWSVFMVFILVVFLLYTLSLPLSPGRMVIPMGYTLTARRVAERWERHAAQSAGLKASLAESSFAAGSALLTVCKSSRIFAFCSLLCFSNRIRKFVLCLAVRQFKRLKYPEF